MAAAGSSGPGRPIRGAGQDPPDAGRPAPRSAPRPASAPGGRIQGLVEHPSLCRQSRHRVTSPSHAESCRRVTSPSHVAESRRRVTSPSHATESHHRAMPPSHITESRRRVPAPRRETVLLRTALDLSFKLPFISFDCPQCPARRFALYSCF